MQLTELANKHATDKGTFAGLGHGYSLLYDLLFAGRRSEPLALCEIGLCIGGPEVADGAANRTTAAMPSISMWHEYFPNATLYGVDISDFSGFETEWFRFVRADCGDPKQLDKVRELGVQFDIIIDDGSHAAFHQQLTFLKLFPLLKNGGLYFIEDLQWQPSTYSGKLPRVPRTDIILSQFVATGAFFASGDLPLADWRALEGSIGNVFLIDEDWLYLHRRQFNGRARLQPEFAAFPERFAKGGRLNLAFWARLMGRLRSELEGPDGNHRRPRVKLAIIQKSA